MGFVAPRSGTGKKARYRLRAPQPGKPAAVEVDAYGETGHQPNNHPLPEDDIPFPLKSTNASQPFYDASASGLDDHGSCARTAGMARPQAGRRSGPDRLAQKVYT